MSCPRNTGRHHHHRLINKLLACQQRITMYVSSLRINKTATIHTIGGHAKDLRPKKLCVCVFFFRRLSFDNKASLIKDDAAHSVDNTSHMTPTITTTTAGIALLPMVRQSSYLFY